MADKRDRENSSSGLKYCEAVLHVLAVTQNSGIFERDVSFYKRLIRAGLFFLPVPGCQAEELISRKPLS